MMRLIAIARNAFIETIRQPIYGVLILVTFGALALGVPLSGWTMGRDMAEYKATDQLMMINMGLSTLLFSGLLIAAFSAGSVLAREIEDRTILTVISKPVPRAAVVLGKFVGVAAALVVAYYICSLVFLMCVRHGVMPTASDHLDMPVITIGLTAFVAALATAAAFNYLFGWHFLSSLVAFEGIALTAGMALISVIGKGWQVVPFGTEIPADVLMGMLLGLFCVLIFAALAVAASTRLSQVMTLLVCLGFYFGSPWACAMMVQYRHQYAGAWLGYQVWPNMTYYYTALDALAQGKSVPGSYVGMTAIYTVCQLAAILAMGVALFERRELEVQAETASSAPLGVSIIAWLGRSAAVLLALPLVNTVITLVTAVVMPGRFGLHWLSMLLSVGLGIAAGVMWLLSGWFGKGVKWTWALYLLVALAGLVAEVVLLALGRIATTAGVVEIAATAVVALTLILPKTRHHFGFVPRKAKFEVRRSKVEAEPS